MRAIAVVAWVGLISCASSRTAVTPVRAASVARDSGAPIRWNPGQSTAFDHGDWVAGHESDPWVVERRDARTRLIDTTIRAEIAEDGTITVARQRPRRHIAEVFAARDGRWIFVTTDGLVLSAPSFLGDFSTRAELPARLNTARRRAHRTPAMVSTNDHALWALDDPSAPRRVRDPALTEVIDAAFVDERRAIAITTPGRLWLSSDAGRSFQSLDSPEGVPLELWRSGDSSLRIRTTGAWWRVTNDGRVREAPDESDESNTPARLDASESNRWRQWRERALWPFGTLTMGPVVNDAAITGDPETEQLVLRRRSGETFPITVELNDPRASRFGTSIAIRNTDGAITLLDTTTGHPRRLPRAPNANPSHYAVFADDGSVIANIQPDMQHLDYWTPEGDWRSTTLAEPVTIAHARAQKIYGTTEDGIVEISLQADGAASIRSIARFSALGRPRAGLETYESSSQDNSTRAWLYRSNGGHSCVVIVEDGTAASTIDLPASNADCTAVHFVDARFGVVAGFDGVAVTRDGRTWQRVDTSTVRVDQPLFYPLFLWQFVRAIDRDSIFVFPGHRITREAPSTPPVVYRSSPLPESEPDNEQGEQQHARCTVRQRQQSAQVQREVERTGNVAIVRVSTDRQSIELRWISDGSSATYAGATPWRDAEPSHTQLPLFARARALASHGVIVELSEERAPLTGRRNQSTSYLFTESGAQRLSGVSLREELNVAIADAVATERGWILLLVHRCEAFDVYEWQRRDAVGAVIEHGAFSHRASNSMQLARMGSQWGAVDWDKEGASFVDFSMREQRRLRAPRALQWCRASRGSGALYLRRSNAPIMLTNSDGEHIEEEHSVVDYRVTRERDDDRWCIERVHSPPMLLAGAPSEWYARASNVVASPSRNGADGEQMDVWGRGSSFESATLRCDRFREAPPPPR